MPARSTDETTWVDSRRWRAEASFFWTRRAKKNYFSLRDNREKGKFVEKPVTSPVVAGS
jgi:hypothetical protein